jgi:hypothetical protein
LRALASDHAVVVGVPDTVASVHSFNIERMIWFKIGASLGSVDHSVLLWTKSNTRAAIGHYSLHVLSLHLLFFSRERVLFIFGDLLIIFGGIKSFPSSLNSSTFDILLTLLKGMMTWNFKLTFDR